MGKIRWKNNGCAESSENEGAESLGRGCREGASFSERLQIALFFCNLAVRKKTYRKRELCYQKHYKMP